MRVRTLSGAWRDVLVAALLLALLALIAVPAQANARRPARLTSCLDTELQPTGADLGRIRTATLCLVNRERAERSERPLAPSSQLGQAAQRHAESMAFGDYFAHVGPRGETPLSRIRASGYISSAQTRYEVGENIGWGSLWLATPSAMVAAWMASPAHRANILDPRFRATAVGVFPELPASLARGQAGAIYTQDFGASVIAPVHSTRARRR